MGIMLASPHPDNGPKEQLRRRHLIAKVVLELATEGGYDAVQLRVISKRSGIALATIYKYYGSRDVLLTSVMTRWRIQTTRKAVAKIEGKGFADRTLSITRYVFNAFKAKPKLFETFARLQREGQRLDLEIETDAVIMSHEFEGLDEQFIADFHFIVGSVLYSGLHFCIYGKRSYREVWLQIERTIRRLANSASRRQDQRREIRHARTAQRAVHQALPTTRARARLKASA
jgi:AcrR family transcriptional regulator